MTHDLPDPFTTAPAPRGKPAGANLLRPHRWLALCVLALWATAHPVFAELPAESERPRPITRTVDSRGTAPVVKSGSWVSSGMALSLVLTLMTAGAWAAKRSGYGVPPARTDGPLHTVARLPLDSRTMLLVVRCGARLLILGVHPGGVASLGEITDPEEARSLLAQLNADEPAVSTSLWHRFMTSTATARNAA